jgi:hypothetical protein
MNLGIILGCRARCITVDGGRGYPILGSSNPIPTTVTLTSPQVFLGGAVSPGIKRKAGVGLDGTRGIRTTGRRRTNVGVVLTSSAAKANGANRRATRIIGITCPEGNVWTTIGRGADSPVIDVITVAFSTRSALICSP